MLHPTQSRLFWRRPFTANHLTDTEPQENTQTKYNSKKQTKNTAAQHYPGLVVSYDIWPVKVGLYYNAAKSTRGEISVTPHAYLPLSTVQCLVLNETT